MYGKPPQKWPESLEEAKHRFIVRIEHYIEQSADTRSNYIIVTHADAVAAALAMFERGNADVQSMDFCAQVTATRTIKDVKKEKEMESVFKDRWKVEFVRTGAQIMDDPGAMAKYYEKMHIDQCTETEQKATARRDRRTKTDHMFMDALKKAAAEEDEDEDEDEDPPPNGNKV